jgi:hypothetical protein
MRSDMKDLLVNTGRVGGGGKAAASRRARFKRMDDEELPLRISSARHRQFGWDGKELGDRLNPLHSFLEKNCGRQWDDVYSEICEHADMRSVRGYHLRQHVWNYVVPNNYDVGHDRRYGPFFVDVDGALQKEKPHVYNWRPKEENPRLRLDEDHRWEKIEGFWYEFVTEHFTHPNSREELTEENGEVKIVRITLPDIHEHIETKRQVDGKTQKDLDAKWLALQLPKPE